ncbi:MAG: hypothetical protein ACRC0G_10780 [Fusobacteriaceae bacterium]
MAYKLLKTFLTTLIRTSTSVKTREVMNNGDTRWECCRCGSIKPKVASKNYTDEGPICLKCFKEDE